MRYFKDKDNDTIRAVDKNQENIIKNNWVELTEEEKKEIEQPPLSRHELKSKAKIEGEYYNNYLIPFTKADADGLTFVKNAFELGVETTNIHFSNGTVMPVNFEYFEDFAKWFIKKRNEFFV